MPAYPLPRAGLWRRLMCWVYEALIVFALLVFFGYAFSAVTHYTGQPGPLRALFQAWLVMILGVYFGWFWSEGRCSLPMKTLSVRVVDMHDRPISRQRALGRYGLALLMLLGPLMLAEAGHHAALLLLALPVLTAACSRARRTPYDWLSGTRLALANQAFAPQINGPTTSRTPSPSQADTAG